jgi:hypothetical protein
MYLHMLTHSRLRTPRYFLGKKVNKQTGRAGTIGMAPKGDQNPLKNQQIQERKSKGKNQSNTQKIP